jgi:hypothetical protein
MYQKLSIGIFGPAQKACCTLNYAAPLNPASLLISRIVCDSFFFYRFGPV